MPIHLTIFLATKTSEGRWKCGSVADISDEDGTFLFALRHPHCSDGYSRFQLPAS